MSTRPHWFWRSIYNVRRNGLVETLTTHSAHVVILTLIQRCLDVNDVVTTSKQRRMLTGKYEV